jgi:hypothetical protein
LSVPSTWMESAWTKYKHEIPKSVKKHLMSFHICIIGIRCIKIIAHSLLNTRSFITYENSNTPILIIILHTIQTFFCTISGCYLTRWPKFKVISAPNLRNSKQRQHTQPSPTFNRKHVTRRLLLFLFRSRYSAFRTIDIPSEIRNLM